DPRYDRVANGPQKLLTLSSATVTFPKFGVTGTIDTFTPTGGNAIPGLQVWDNGFQLGVATLIYKPGQSGQQPGQLSSTSASSGKIRLGSIVEFDDLRISVENFKVTFGSAVDFNGNIFIASGGATFLPGKPVSATFSDRLSAEPTDKPGNPDTEAVRITLEFTAGKVTAFKLKVDTMKITLGSILTLTARDIIVDTGADPTEELVSFASIGAVVDIGGLELTGEAKNFAFLGDGSFETKPGFGVVIGVGSATGDT